MYILQRSWYGEPPTGQTDEPKADLGRQVWDLAHLKYTSVDLEVKRTDCYSIIGQEIIRSGFGVLPQWLVDHGCDNHDRNHEEADNGCGDHPSAALFHYHPFSSAPGSVCPSIAMGKGAHAAPSEIQTLVVPRLLLPLRRPRVTQLVE